MWLVVGLVLLAWWRLFRRRDPAVSPSEPDAATSKRRRAALTLGLAYTAFAAWTFVAWYRRHKPLRKYRWGGDGWLGPETYAGGADKFGHAWATMVGARVGTAILNRWGGYDRTKASVVSASLSELFFTGVEVNDGFFYEFSFSDLAGDSVGAVLGLMLDNFPRLQELFAFRVQYFPSLMYARKVAGTSPCPGGGCSRWNVAEDYSGETYLTALHLSGIRAIRNSKLGTASRFVDVAAGFDSRNYKPNPDADITDPARQEVFLGLSFNAQGFFDWLLEDRTSPAARRTRTITHGLFEVCNLPFTTLPLVRTTRDRPPRPAKTAKPIAPRGYPGRTRRLTIPAAAPATARSPARLPPARRA